jgi:predicted MFS family arabinose efflux permease
MDSTTFPPTDGVSARHARAPNPWPAVFSVALSATVFCAAEFLPVGLLRFVSNAMNVSEGTAGLMVTAPAVLGAFAAPLVTVAVGSHDRRKVLLFLAALLVIANLLAMAAPDFGVLIAARVLFGVGLGGFWAIGAGLGGRLVPEKSTARATSIIFAGVSAGMLIGGSAGALIGELFGWRTAFGAALALSVIAFVAQLAYLPHLHVQQRIRVRDLWAPLASRNGRVGAVAMLFAVGGQFATYTYATPFLANVTGFDGKTISSILLGYTAIGMLGTFLGGVAVNANPKAALVGVMLSFIAPVLVLPSFGHVDLAVLILFAIWGAAYGAMPVALQMWMARSTPGAGEAAMALLTGNYQVAIALGSLVGGLVVDHQGLNAAMYIGATFAAVGMVFVAVFARALPSEPNSAG